MRLARDWKFWATLACTLPMAYTSLVLTWLYMLSFSVWPNGAVAYVGTGLAVFGLGWAVRGLFFYTKEVKASRAMGKTLPYNYKLGLWLLAGISTFIPGVVASALLSTLSPLSSADWVKLAHLFLVKEIGL